ncbi:uncharacterized protein LOC116804613 isoform X2 [Drosophila mojavensis]|uniref:uncharacterized protein LOC116804613 isoform X2 n=1 Tax=Drosophila mojavensis TaxID=7230 RepID=UPI001CD0CD0E|nr:uncharacterized protein LOC116804613 isoform X2 [Drosophila mojavensis]
MTAKITSTEFRIFFSLSSLLSLRAHFNFVSQQLTTKYKRVCALQGRDVCESKLTASISSSGTRRSS